jgi:hypothetical protein
MPPESLGPRRSSQGATVSTANEAKWSASLKVGWTARMT